MKITFQKWHVVEALINSVNNDDYSLNNVTMTVIDGANIHSNVVVRVKQTAGSDSNDRVIEVELPKELENISNYPEFSAAVGDYYKKVIGLDGNSAMLKSNGKNLTLRGISLVGVWEKTI